MEFRNQRKLAINGAMMKKILLGKSLILRKVYVERASVNVFQNKSECIPRNVFFL